VARGRSYGDELIAEVGGRAGLAGLAVGVAHALDAGPVERVADFACGALRAAAAVGFACIVQAHQSGAALGVVEAVDANSLAGVAKPAGALSVRGASRALDAGVVDTRLAWALAVGGVEAGDADLLALITAARNTIGVVATRLRRVAQPGDADLSSSTFHRGVAADEVAGGGGDVADLGVRTVQIRGAAACNALADSDVADAAGAILVGLAAAGLADSSDAGLARHTLAVV